MFSIGLIMGILGTIFGALVSSRAPVEAKGPLVVLLGVFMGMYMSKAEMAYFETHSFSEFPIVIAVVAVCTILGIYLGIGLVGLKRRMSGRAGDE